MYITFLVGVDLTTKLWFRNVLIQRPLGRASPWKSGPLPSHRSGVPAFISHLVLRASFISNKIQYCKYIVKCSAYISTQLPCTIEILSEIFPHNIKYFTALFPLRDAHISHIVWKSQTTSGTAHDTERIYAICAWFGKLVHLLVLL